MNQRTVIFLIVLAVLAYLFLNSKENFEENDQTTWPTSFTWDWNGGHGRDRYEIMKDGPTCIDCDDGPTY